MKFYPINLKLEAKRVLLIGGGEVALRKLKRLKKAQAKITIISPEVIEEVEGIIKEGQIEYYKRAFSNKDIEGYFLVIAATDDAKLNSRVGSLADENGTLVNVVDNKGASNFTLPSVVNRGDLLFTISTGGKLPALSKELRISLEKDFGQGYGDYLNLMGEVRDAVKERVPNEERRREIFKQLADLEMIDLFSKDRRRGIEKVNQILDAF